MTSNTDGQDDQTNPLDLQQNETSIDLLDWLDADGRSWRIEIFSDLIVLHGDGDTLELPQSSWTQDIYVAPHGDGYIIRFDSFSRSIGFVVAHEQAQTLLSHVGQAPDTKTDNEIEEETSNDDKSLLWPRVSPQAVWALICSSLVFLPVIGLIPAVITTALLVLHRRIVRSVHAYRHSRILCRAAFLFLVTGLVVSSLGTRGMASNFPQSSQRDELYRAAGLPERIFKLSPHGDETDIRSADFSQPDGRSPTIKAGSSDKQHNWGLIVAALFVVLLSLTVHEAAHAITAWWLGDDFARRIGRVTLNPAAHIDPFGTILLPLLLFLAGAGVFGWAKPVPVRLENVRRPRRAHILISMAGPGSNLLLAAASMLLLIGIGCVIKLVAPQAQASHLIEMSFSETVTMSGFAAAPVLGPLCTLLKLGFIVNVFLAFFNLIPIPPLDGSWVLEHLFPRTLGPLYARLRPFSFLLFLILLYSHLLPYLLFPAMIVLLFGFQLLGACTFV